MQEFLKVLDLLAAGKISNQDPRVEEALREAVAFCRGALPLDEREESAIVSRAAYRVAESGTQHASDVAQMVKKERAQAHAAGYAKAMRQRNEAHESDVQSYSDERARLIPENLSLTAQLSAAQAEIENLTQQVDYYNECGYDTHVELVAAQAEIERLSSAVDTTCAHCDSWFKESVVIETQLTNLRTAAERYLGDGSKQAASALRAVLKEIR